MLKINFLPTKGNACDAVFDLKYKQFDFALFSVEAKIHVKANLPIEFWSMSLFKMCLG
jgi:hypothetical protein